MAKYTVIVPVEGAQTKANTKLNDEAFIGPSTRDILNEDELKAWFEMFLADKSLARRVYIERHGR